MKHVYWLILAISSVGFSQNTVQKWTLNDCVLYAIRNNLSIQQTKLNGATAEVSKKQALGNFLPVFNVTSTHSWNIGLNQDITTGILQNQTTQYSAIDATVSIDIYKGLQNQNNLRKAKLTLLAAQYQAQKMQEDVSLNVVNAFLELLFATENIAVQLKQLEQDKQQYQRTLELIQAGVVPQGDLLEIDATLATDNQKIIIAQNTALLAKLSLAQLLQLEYFEQFEIDVLTDAVLDSTIINQDVKAVWEQSQKNKAILKLAQTNLELAQKEYLITKGGLQPTLKGFYNFNSRIAYADVLGQVPPSFFSQFNANKGQTFGFQLAMPILNGFSMSGNAQKAKINIEASRLSLIQEQASLKKQVYAAYTDLIGSKKNYEAAKKVNKTRKTSYEFAKEKANIGMLNGFELSQQQLLFVNSETDLLRAKYDFLFKIKILEFYFGIPIV